MNEYKWITNIEKGAIKQSLIVLKELKIEYKITELLNDDKYYALFFLNTEKNMNKMIPYFDLWSDICQMNKKIMIESGFATKEEIGHKSTYLGCEKVYFPERDTKLIKDYRKKLKKNEN